MGGAWIGNLTALAPYQPIFVALSLGLLGYGYWLVYRRPKAACAEAAACARPMPNRTVKLVLWLATVLVSAAVAFPSAAIGRASRRARVWQYVSILVVAGTIQKITNTQQDNHERCRDRQYTE